MNQRTLPEKETNPRIDICPANPIIRNSMEFTVGELVEDLLESDDFIHPNEGQLEINYEYCMSFDCLGKEGCVF